MLDAVLFVALPYVSLVALVVGTALRFRHAPLGVTSMSSQLLEKRQLALGSAPWHFGILLVLLGHLAAFAVPGLWRTVTANQHALIAIEVTGLAAGLLCALGLALLLVRRLTSGAVQAVTGPADLLVLALLLGQVLLGLTVALEYRWGAAWSAGTLAPYLWGLLLLRPDPTYVVDLPPLIKAHLVGAWLIVLLIPFTRLIHILAAPLHYLTRAPQRVLWASRRYAEGLTAARGEDPSDARRHFLRGALASAAGLSLLGIGAADKVLRFLGKQDVPRKEQVELLELRHARVQVTAEERALELERLRNDYIFVARLDQLQARAGKYFIDYQMRPALAFRGEDGLPILIGAKCTHLGCTVGREVDEQGRILCPCHISFFDIRTGEPNAGAPAREPLPHLGWVLRNDRGDVVARRLPSGTVEPPPPGADLARYGVYIAKEHEEARL